MKRLRILSIIMAICMLICSFSFISLAQTTVYNDIGQTQEQPTEALYEIERLREESVKHFRLSDGTYTAVNYNTPVHYLYEDKNQYV